MRSIGQCQGKRYSNEFLYAVAEPAELAAVEQYSENGKPLCVHPNCEKEARTRNRCQNHYQQLRRREGIGK